jgi:hypothetical protein
VSQEWKARSQARARVSVLSTTAEKVAAAVFVEPPAVVVTVEELSNCDALQSLRAVDSEELLSALAATPLDNAAVWLAVMQSVTKYGLVVEEELPRASEASRYTLWTKPIGSNDTNWFYQKFYEVSLSNSMSRNGLRKGATFGSRPNSS